MSFDLDIATTDIDGNRVVHEVVCGHTYNLAPMWYKALPFLTSTKDLDGMLCRDLHLLLTAGLVDIWENHAEYKALNPENGWGDFEGFVEIFARFTRMTLQYPSGKVEWSG